MKKLFLLSSMLFLATFVFGQKFGHINSGALLRVMPEVTAADSDIEGYRKLKIKEGQSKAQALQADAQKLEEDYQVNGIISAQQYQERGAELQKRQAELQAFEQDLYQKLSEKKEQLYQPILEKINTAINDVSKEQGYTMIFDSSTGILLFADDATDVTNLVKGKLGISTTTAAPAPPAGGN